MSQPAKSRGEELFERRLFAETPHRRPPRRHEGGDRGSGRGMALRILPRDVVFGASLVECLSVPTVSPRALRRGTTSTRTRVLPGVVAADEGHDGGLAVRIEQVRLAAREKGCGRVVVPRDLGPQVAGPLDDVAEASEPVSMSIAGPGVVLVGLRAPAEVERREPPRGLDDPQARLERTGTPARSVTWSWAPPQA